MVHQRKLLATWNRCSCCGKLKADALSRYMILSMEERVICLQCYSDENMKEFNS